MGIAMREILYYQERPRPKSICSFNSITPDAQKYKLLFAKITRFWNQAKSAGMREITLEDLVTQYD